MPLNTPEIMQVFEISEILISQPNIQLITLAVDRIESQLGVEAIDELRRLLTQATTIQTALYANPGNGALIRADVIEWSKGGAYAAQTTALNSLKTKILRMLGLDWLAGGGSNNHLKVDSGGSGGGSVPAWYNPVGY